MLPSFPEFKRIELSDKADVEQITSKYEPYSDFDFASMWSWDVNDNTMLSELNGNLVAILSDHFTSTPFYSYLGDNDINRTLKQLFAFSVRGKNFAPALKLVPEVSLKDIDLKKYLIEIDLNNSDYIYDLEEQTTYAGSKYGNKRKLFNRFVRDNPDHSVQVLDLMDEKVRNDILKLSESWSKMKTTEDEGVNLRKEMIAINRFLDAGFEESLCVGVIVNSRLIGYEIFTILNNKYAISHFSKTNTAYVGVYEFLANKYAAVLLSRGITLLNAEEDLGLPGLRFSKNSFRPTGFLRKYTIREL